jgi:hypothetical protein
MMFLFGALLGATLASGSSTTSLLSHGGFGGIPLRCLMVMSEADYRACRTLSMRAELLAQSRTEATGIGICGYVWSGQGNDVGKIARAVTADDVCSVSRAIDLELAALKQLNAALETKKH